MSLYCTFRLPNGEVCYREPVAADYFETDEIKGWLLVASLCYRHDNSQARRYAMARGYERRTRVTAIASPDVGPTKGLVPSSVLEATPSGESTAAVPLQSALNGEASGSRS